MKVSFFGPLTDITGTSVTMLDGVVDTDDLHRRLLSQFPGLAGRTFAVSVDRRIVQGNTPLSQTSEVALLPPFSGG
jgi:sulfur-carrier protein